MAHININSVRNRFLPLYNILHYGLQDNIRCIILQETKLDSWFHTNQFHVPGFKTYRKDFKQNSGDIMCFVKNDLAPRCRNDLEINLHISGRIEILAIEVHLKNSK